MGTDPYGNYYYKLEVGTEGTEIQYAVEVSGLKTSAQVFEIEEGGLNGRVHKRIGQSKWENVVVRYATSGSKELVQWRNDFLSRVYGSTGDSGKPLKRPGSIIQYDNYGNPVRRYHFSNAWPVSWEGPSFNAGGSEVAMETLELAHDGIEVTEG